MSVHTKKKIPPHLHTKDEVVEARAVRPLRPAYKGIHGSDVVIDSNLLLSETLIEWLRYWEAEGYEWKDDDWAEVSDSKASKGKAMRILSAGANGQELRLVNSGDLNIAGDLYLVMRLKVASNASGSTILRIGIWNTATSTWIGYLDIKPSDFPASNEYHHFAVRMNLPADVTTCRVLAQKRIDNVTDLYCDYAGLVPAHIPLGYADVTVVTTDPSSTADSTDPSSSADSTDPSSGADTKDPSSTGDSTDPSTTSLNDNMGHNDILDEGSYHSQVEVTNSLTLVHQVTCGSESDAVNLSSVLCRVLRGSSGGYGHIRLSIYHDTVPIHECALYISGDLSGYDVEVLTPWSFSGITLKIYAKKDGDGSIWIRTKNRVRQFTKHSHAIQNDSHGHTISGDSHNHTVSGDAHVHTVSGDAHPHTISGDSHTHSDTEGGHEH